MMSINMPIKRSLSNKKMSRRRSGLSANNVDSNLCIDRKRRAEEDRDRERV
jgi:hypothetical protein